MLDAYADKGEDGLHEVMKETGYNYNVSTSSKDFKVEDDSEISPDVRYSKGSSDLTVHTFDDPEDDERIRVQVIVNLEDTTVSAGYPTWAEDTIAVSYNGDDWTNVGEASLRITPDEGGSIELFPGSVEDGGLAAIIDLDSVYTDATQNVLLAQSLHNLRGIPGTIYGSYVHSWSPNPSSVSVDSVQGGDGPVEVSFDGRLDNDWQITDDEDTDELID
ncbi:hypothetical protein [Natrialba magadii]|uniref:hypothetical protein n=1 Tax=Natrialba magadii TaxID=13769 RepID=UPI00174DEF61|nr:hypothetical protein [Natrialba magadii]